jgi:ATP-dependent RNA helicase DDX41
MGPPALESNDQEDPSSSITEWKKKREARRRLREVQEDLNRDVDNESFEKSDAFVPLAKRRRMEQEALLLTTLDKSSNGDRKLLAQRRKQAYASLHGGGTAPEPGNHSDDDDNNSGKNRRTNGKGNSKENEQNQEHHIESLLEQAAALQQTRTDVEKLEQQRKEEETRILREASQVQTNALQAASELALGVVYTEPMSSSWTVPRYILEQGEEVWQKVRKEWHIDVEGYDIPPPLRRFKDMKFPKPIIDALEEKNIKRPTPIQMQGLSVALAGRDMVGIAFTGSGKTLTFSLPLVMAALEEELRMPLVPGEGPVGIILAPSRELARQTFDVVNAFCENLSQTKDYPQLRAQLLIGGESVRDQLRTVQQQGIHAIVATPGRLRDILKRRAMNLSICRYICLDEADRMLDLVSKFILEHSRINRF